MVKELGADELAWSCNDEWLPWASSEEIEPATTIVGQDRAVDAIALGLAMGGIGYNIFVTGMSGTGRLTTIKRFLDQLADSEPLPDDICFVHNFRNPEEPKALFLEAGAGSRLRDALEDMITELSENLPGIFADKEFRGRVERAVEGLQRQERELVEEFESEVRAAGFSLVQIQAGPVSRPEILPVVGDKPVPMEQLGALVEQGELSGDDASRFSELYTLFTDRLHDLFQSIGELRERIQERVEHARERPSIPCSTWVVNRVRTAVADERAAGYLGALRQDLQESLNVFVSSDRDVEEPEQLQRWKANLVVDNADTSARPVILETEPSYTRLFGTVERTLTPSGEPTTSFMRIRAGSLLRANGGFLVLNADDLLVEPRVWPGLKRALKYRRVQIQSLETMVFGAAALKPEPIPLDVKVVIIGDRGIYDALYRHDTDFPKVFKILADFDSVMTSSSDRAQEILSVLRKVSTEDGLLPMDRSAMAAMLEQAVRLARWRRKFSSRFSDLGDILREAAFYAERSGSAVVMREHVAGAEHAHRQRHSLSEDRSHEYVSQGLIRIDTEGEAVGQVNGLAVYDLGHHRFGKPSRITARVGLGREGVINVERQAGLSGPSHDKGVSILTGFLRGTFARSVPLNMSCSVTFEQSYGGIDGDSASSTEVYAILSSLAGAPIRQEIAVTGSVDQYGRVQSIGGVNEKIEGFYRVCSAGGLTGRQGVLIPSANVDDLHLAHDVVKAVRDGLFHVWSTDCIEEGIETLTGVSAGKWDDEKGCWTPDSIFARCQERLDTMATLLRQAGKGPSEKNEGETETETAEEE